MTNVLLSPDDFTQTLWEKCGAQTGSIAPLAAQLASPDDFTQRVWEKNGVTAFQSPDQLPAPGGAHKGKLYPRPKVAQTRKVSQRKVWFYHGDKLYYGNVREFMRQRKFKKMRI